MIQTQDVSKYATEIDAGGKTITVKWWQHGSGGAAGQLNIDFDYLDEFDVLISTTEGTPKLVVTNQYEQQSQVGTIPALTRKIVISAVQDTGGVTDMFVEDFTIATTLVDPNFPDDEFNYGVLTFDSGLNAGLSMERRQKEGLGKIAGADDT